MHAIINLRKLRMTENPAAALKHPSRGMDPEILDTAQGCSGL